MGVEIFRCEYDGILFRSRNEAWWFEYFRSIGFVVSYEPETFRLTGFEESDTCLYIPDFMLRVPSEGTIMYVETKPMMKWSKYQERDVKSFGKAIVFGYKMPMCIVVGDPGRYCCFFVSDRHKGNPELTPVKITDGPGFIKYTEKSQIAGCYPDEDWLQCDLSGLSIAIFDGGNMAKESFNKTRWSPRK